MTDANAISQHFLRSEDHQWAETFKTNVTGQYFMAMAMLPLLAKGREVTPGYTSQVVNVSSISGQMKGSSNGQFAYASSKAACTHVSRMLATTFKDCKVRVNTIAPGIFPSEMTTGKSNEKNKSELSTQIQNPAGRGGHDSDMAATILMLAGPGGLFYNEQTMFPDGMFWILDRYWGILLLTHLNRRIHPCPTDREGMIEMTFTCFIQLREHFYHIHVINDNSKRLKNNYSTFNDQCRSQPTFAAERVIPSLLASCVIDSS
jgi:hypothetical protein